MSHQENPKEENTLDPTQTEEKTQDVESHFDENLATQFSELQSKHQEVSDAYLRAKAEVENVRKRSEEELSKTRRFAIESFSRSLLPVKDSLEAALNTPNQSIETLQEGVSSTLKQLASIFESNKIEEIVPSKGDKFDPHFHEAVSVVVAQQEPNTIVEVLQKGYSLAGRTLRPAIVTVATKQ